ncbi:hypothetical protein AB0H34_38485, partial [Saccharopolyspora shandongensis]|uniref:hypothetical protein n=1 Tax=Saccharopolyspora shandongensis TaxID=418495 RepID=UPI0033E610A7
QPAREEPDTEMKGTAKDVTSRLVRLRLAVGSRSVELAQLARIEDSAAAFTSPSAHVTVEALLPTDGSAR